MPEKQYARIVHVPKTEAGAFNPHRPISTLIQHQLKHLRDVEKDLPADQQTGIDISKIETELQASDYIQKVTARLHPQGRKKSTGAKGKRGASRKK